jgi:nucleotide-binding universal stress UspA family protein
MQRILCAVDHSEPSLRAVRVALRLAAGCKFDLLLLNAVRLPEGEQSGIADYLRYEHNADPPGVVVLDAARDELARLREQLSPESGVAITCATRTGEAAAAIVAAARDYQAELIVIGHRGQNRLAQALLGSVARRVLETAPCPVVVVR